MSGENLWGVNSKRIRAGLYLVEGWDVEDVKGTIGWQIRKEGQRSRWFGTRGEAYGWIYNFERSHR